MLLPLSLLALKISSSIIMSEYTLLLLRSSTHRHVLDILREEEELAGSLASQLQAAADRKAWLLKLRLSQASLTKIRLPVQAELSAWTILGGSHLRYRDLLQQNYGTTTTSPSVKDYIFKSQGLFVAFWHTACWNCAYQGLWSISDSTMAFQHVLCLTWAFTHAGHSPEPPLVTIICHYLYNVCIKQVNMVGTGTRIILQTTPGSWLRSTGQLFTWIHSSYFLK